MTMKSIMLFLWLTESGQGAKNGIGQKFIEINIAPKGYVNEP